jgi:hypothetical protein
VALTPGDFASADMEQTGAEPVPASVDEVGDDGGRRTRWHGAALCAVVFAVFALSPVRQNYDSYLSLPTAYTIVHGRTLDLSGLESPKVRDHYANVEGADGTRVNYFPWAGSLWFVPAVLALDAAHLVGLGPGAHEVADGGPMDVIQVLVASAVLAGAIALVAATVLDRLDPRFARRRQVALLVAGGLAFGTSVWSVASRAFWQHTPSLFALAAALYCLQRLTGAVKGRSSLAAGAGLALGLAYTFRPTNGLTILAVSAYLVACHRRSIVPYLTGAAAVAVPWMAVNVEAYGSPLQPYYAAQRVGWHLAFPEALAANLISPARGLVIFSPIVLLAPLGLARRWRDPLRPGLRRLDVALAVAVVAQIVAASAYGDNWWAGHSYGPRLLTDTLVPLALLATPTVAALWPAAASTRPRVRPLAIAAVLALAWSTFVASQGALSRATSCWSGEPNIDVHLERVWSWGDPQFLAGVKRFADTRSVRAAALDGCGADDG